MTAADREAPVLEVGARLDRYTIQGVLGQGGMGCVYLADDEKLRRRVALKVVRSGGVGTEATARLVREARAAAALQHPNVVAIHDIGESDGTTFIAMELVTGRTLRARLEEPQSVEIRLTWLRDVARALEAAHKKSIVHRDVKPDNVMITDEGLVKVLDFGIARRASGALDPTAQTVEEGLATITTDGVAIGTPLYMAPEQLQGKDTDGRTDQFAWGVMAFEVFAGKPPWRARDAVELVASILSLDPPPLEVPGLSGDVEAAIRRALEKDPARRFASMTDLLAAIAPGAPTATTTAQRPVPARRRARILPVVLALAALAVAGGWMWSRGAKPSPAAPSASAPPRPTAQTELPAPSSSNPLAVEAYLTAVQAMRDGNEADAATGFDHAIELDPGMAAAYLRRAILEGVSVDAANFFAKAVERRRNLDARDAAILDALSPVFQKMPADHEEARTRLQRLLGDRPGDVEIALLVACVERLAGDSRATVAAADRVIALDDHTATPWYLKLEASIHLGDLAGAHAAVDGCLARLPTSKDCLFGQLGLDAMEGRCDALERDARAMLVVAPKDPDVAFDIGRAGIANERPLDTVRTTLENASQYVPEGDRERYRMYNAIFVAEAEADFAAADELARKLAAQVATAPGQPRHFHPMWIRLRLLEEMGRGAEAGRLATSYLRERDAYVPSPLRDDNAALSDCTPILFAARRRAGLIGREEVVRERDAWLDKWRAIVGPDARPSLWILGHAATVEDEASAREAVAALSTYGPIPSIHHQILDQGAVGRTLLLAGQVDDAIARLELATHACVDLWRLLEHTQAFLWLGRAREAKGDVAGACSAYGEVVRRWGHARPRSVSSEEAAKRAAALACPK